MIIGLDSNILIYALDPAYPEHKCVSNLLVNLSSKKPAALNPTIIHEAYHVLVFQLEWFPQEAAEKLSMLLKHPNVEFYNQTKKTSKIALDLAVKHNLGGRDALIIANFLANKVPLIYTHDQEILKLHKLSWRHLSVTFKDPLISPSQ